MTDSGEAGCMVRPRRHIAPRHHASGKGHLGTPPRHANQNGPGRNRQPAPRPRLRRQPVVFRRGWQAVKANNLITDVLPRLMASRRRQRLSGHSRLRLAFKRVDQISRFQNDNSDESTYHRHVRSLAQLCFVS